MSADYSHLASLDTHEALAAYVYSSLAESSANDPGPRGQAAAVADMILADRAARR